MRFMSNAVNYGFGAVFVIGIICSVVKMYSVYSSRSALAFLAVIFVIGVALGICYGFSKLEEYLKGKDELCCKLLAVLPVILLILQFLFVIWFDLTPKNDLSHICKAAENYVKYGVDSIYDGLPQWHQHYFAVYPNNHMLFMIVAGLYKVTYMLTGQVTNFLPTLINVIALNMAFIFMIKTALAIYEPAKAFICGLRGLMFTPVITYATFFYTDSLAMPFVSAGIYFYIKCRRKEKLSEQILLTAVCGLLIGIGYEIKGSLIILLVAIMIDIILRRGGKKNVAAKISTLIGIFMMTAMILNIIGMNVLGISKEEKCRYEFPKIHWVMMSADGSGGYNREDFFYTKSFDGYENKFSADMDRLGEKLEEQGAAGFAVHILKKMGYTWGNGTYMVPYYNENSTFLNSIPFIAVTEILHFALLFKILQGFIGRRKRDSDILSENFVLKISLIGLFAFLLVWEAKCRYLVSFFALFALI